MRSLLAAVLLASIAARAETPDVLEVAEARIATPAREVVDVQGGIYLSPTGSAAVAKKIVALEAENRAVKAAQPNPVLVLILAATAASLCALGGYVAGRNSK